jgi:hypothetical protein
MPPHALAALLALAATSDDDAAPLPYDPPTAAEAAPTLRQADGAPAQDGVDERLAALARRIEALEAELAATRARGQREQDELAAALAAEIEALKAERAGVAAGASAREGTGFAFGGYGEIHANFREGSGGDVFDIHRLVLYMGYGFNDWIRLDSEIELEHAFVGDDAGGEISIEQLYVDFAIDPRFHVRAGRVLAPLGIVNMRHEPTTFHGVERPEVARAIVPSTWSLDGVGVHGRLADCLDYQLYLTAGLDGSGFDAVDGIRGGRIKERPGLSDPALSGRVDLRPLPTSLEEHGLRVGASFFAGGADNGNQGNDPGVDAEVLVLAADAEYTFRDLDLRGVFAWEEVDGAGALNDAFGNDVAEELAGWYVEAAYHLWPDSWRAGRLAEADLVAFARYEEIDTQRVLPANAASNPAADRDVLTFGVSFFLTPELVLKADYQLFDDASGDDLDDRYNLGIGWSI